MFAHSRCCRSWSRCRRNTWWCPAVPPSPQQFGKSSRLVAMLCTTGWAELPWGSRGWTPTPSTTPASDPTALRSFAGKCGKCGEKQRHFGQIGEWERLPSCRGDSSVFPWTLLTHPCKPQENFPLGTLPALPGDQS